MSIYRENILEHWKNPRNFGKIKNPSQKSYAVNPSCGDELTLELLLKDDQIKEIRFSGNGCAISLASASLLTDYLKGKRVVVMKEVNQETILKLLGVPIGPSRLKCATLILGALKKITTNDQ